MIKERLDSLRAEMKKANINLYYIPTCDYHQSEMVGEHFKCREYMSGFTGSNGDLLVLEDSAYLWTDGRYFLQAESQLEGSTIELMKMGEPGFPTIFEFLQEHLAVGMTLGFDGRVVPANYGLKLYEIANKRNAKINASVDLVNLVWHKRPALSAKKAFELDIKYAGVSRKDKINNLQNTLRNHGYDATVISSLDDIMWLYNLRGNDVESTPVALSYTIVYQDKAVLYINKHILSDAIIKHLEADNVVIAPYFDVYDDIKGLKGKIFFEMGKINYTMYESFSNDAILIGGMNLTTLPKAMKNTVEVENIRLAHIKDGVAVCRFLCWLKNHFGKEEMSEISVADKLFSFRAEQDTFIETSFDTIAGFNEHGAIVHYSATPETNKAIDRDGLLLVDSGGQYYEGTTDITRTIVLGSVSDKCKRDFTNVLKGYLALARAKFKKGCRGSSLDILARNPLWQNYQDFNHGTGHGVGYLLNCHEGPQGIHYGRITGYPFAEGMLTSNEPGLYIENEYGIRHESLLLCRSEKVNEYGEFLGFEVVTLVPFDLDGIDTSLLSKEDIEDLNNYHSHIYEVISPFLNDEERVWLKHACRSI